MLNTLSYANASDLMSWDRTRELTGRGRCPSLVAVTSDKIVLHCSDVTQRGTVYVLFHSLLDLLPFGH